MLNYTTELRKNFPGRMGVDGWGWVRVLVWVVGLAENKANSAPSKLELELWLILAKRRYKMILGILFVFYKTTHSKAIRQSS